MLCQEEVIQFSSNVCKIINSQELGRNHFNFQFVIGKGGFGKVWKVEAKKSKNLFAMKEMSKAKYLLLMQYDRILSKKSVNSVMNEKVLLQ